MRDMPFTYSSIRTARAQAALYAVPGWLVRSWRVQFQRARREHVPFRFDLLSWSVWWRAELHGGPYAWRDVAAGRVCMRLARGAQAYDPGSVVMVFNRAVASALSGGVASRRGAHLRVRGAGHPRSKPVVTPRGVFGSIALAAEAHGVTRQEGARRVRRGTWKRSEE